MESLLEFEKETLAIGGGDNQENLSKSSYGYKLVPWLSWDEWIDVRDSLFSTSPERIASALRRVSTWRSRGCLPVEIDVTASFIEIQQRDPLYRKDLPVDAIHSEQMLAMLYTMAILRLVNCVVEKTRKKTQISIAEAASAIGIPRTLIDIRHEGSHRDLPALPLVRDSAVTAVHWLKSYYWEPQTTKIPFQRDGATDIRKEIKSKLRELAYCLKAKHQHGSSPIKGKRGRHCEQLSGRSKFFSIITSKLQSSKSGSFKKQITKILKSFVGLYSSFSSEVLSVMLEFLLKALNSSNLNEIQKEDQFGQEHTLLDDWKLVVMKLSDSEPELLLMLVKGVLSLIETQDAMKHENGTDPTAPYGTRTGQIEELSSLLMWIIRRLKGLKPPCCKDMSSETKASSTGVVSDAILMEILHKCLRISSCGNRQLMDSALCLAQLMGDTSVMEKLEKLSLLSNLDFGKENSGMRGFNNFLLDQNEAILKGTKKLESVKLGHRKSKADEKRDSNVQSSGRWVVTKLWNPCPIGMLPRELGSSGRLPILDVEKTSADSLQSKHNAEHQNCGVITEPISESMLVNQRVEKSSGKRGASCDIYLFDRSGGKKMREMVESVKLDGAADVLVSDVKGCLMIDGVWKQISEEELLGIRSDVRILV